MKGAFTIVAVQIFAKPDRSVMERRSPTEPFSAAVRRPCRTQEPPPTEPFSAAVRRPCRTQEPPPTEPFSAAVRRPRRTQHFHASWCPAGASWRLLPNEPGRTLLLSGPPQPECWRLTSWHHPKCTAPLLRWCPPNERPWAHRWALVQEPPARPLLPRHNE
jgi:hypothetical protein